MARNPLNSTLRVGNRVAFKTDAQMLNVRFWRKADINIKLACNLRVIHPTPLRSPPSSRICMPA